MDKRSLKQHDKECSVCGITYSGDECIKCLTRIPIEPTAYAIMNYGDIAHAKQKYQPRVKPNLKSSALMKAEYIERYTNLSAERIEKTICSLDCDKCPYRELVNMEKHKTDKVVLLNTIINDKECKELHTALYNHLSIKSLIDIKYKVKGNE